MKRKVLFVLFGTLLLDMVGLGMVIPIIPIIFTDPASPSFVLHGYSTGMQYFFAGLIFALYGLMQFIAAPVLGEISDMFGRKKLLTLGVAVLAASQFLFGFGIEITSVALLLFARAIAGLAGANFSIAQASIADVSEPHERAKNFALIGAAFGIGFILGPLLAGWVSTAAANPAAPFFVAGVLGVINVIFISAFLPETNKQPRHVEQFHFWKGVSNVRAALSDTDARPVYASSFLYTCGFMFFTTFIGILLVARFNVTESEIGTLFAIIGVWIVITQIFILRVFAKRYSELQIVRGSILVIAAAIVICPYLPTLQIFYAVIPIIAIAQGLTLSNLTSLVSQSVSGDKQGAALGINGSLLALAQGTVPLLAGVGSGVIGVHAPFIAASIFMVGAWAFLFGFSKVSV